MVLRSAFDADGRDFGRTPPLPANGEIVFARALPDGSQHLFAVRPGAAGERLLTSGGAADYQDPAVSPDGRTIAVVYTTADLLDTNHEGVIATVPIEGGDPAPLTDPLRRVGDPSWSPDGTQLAFAGIVDDRSQPVSSIFVMNADGSGVRLVAAVDGVDLSAPDWSSDGGTLVFGGLAGATSEAEPKYSDLYVVHIDGSGLTDLTKSPSIDERTPSWSPDGTVIAFSTSTGAASDRILMIDLEGRLAGTVFDDSDAGEIADVEFSPDGRSIAFTSSLALTDADIEGDPDVWTIRVDGTGLTNLTTDGAYGISWQRLLDSKPEPSTSSSVEPAGNDIGFGFPVCQVSQIEAQFDGEGAADTAIVAARREQNGGCPSTVESAQGYVGIDLDGDELVDGSFGPITCEVSYCRAFAAPDLDGDDGKRELLVVESAGSIVGLGIYALGPVPGSPGKTEVVRIHIGEPDLVQTGFVTGEPARLFIGGDEGWSYRLRCEDHGVNRFLYQQRAFRQADSTGPATVDETTLIYWQQRLDVFDAREPEQTKSDDPLGSQPEEVCGAPIPQV
jgi:dipeptidyl aminopeptidase/acylaminoacyl peptidase